MHAVQAAVERACAELEVRYLLIPSVGSESVGML